MNVTIPFLRDGGSCARSVGKRRRTGDLFESIYKKVVLFAPKAFVLRRTRRRQGDEHKSEAQQISFHGHTSPGFLRFAGA